MLLPKLYDEVLSDSQSCDSQSCDSQTIVAHSAVKNNSVQQMCNKIMILYSQQFNCILKQKYVNINFKVNYNTVSEIKNIVISRPMDNSIKKGQILFTIHTSLLRVTNALL